MTPASPAATGTNPTHGCARCGAPVAIDVGLCETCNPLGLRDVSASQVHGTVFLGVVGAIILLAIAARFAIAGVGPFEATVDAVVPVATGLEVTVTVTNEGEGQGNTNCRLTAATNRGGGPSAFLLSPAIGGGETITFERLVTELGTEAQDLVIDCKAP